MNSGNSQTGELVETRKKLEAAVVSALDAGRAQGEIFAAMEFASKYPRDAQAARSRILSDLEDYQTAKDCRYAFSLGGTSVADGSIELARLIALNWKNMAHGFRIVSETAHERVVEGWACDFEGNHHATQAVVFRKALQRKDPDGVTRWIDTDDQGMLDRETKRYAAKVERNAIRACIPPGLWRSAFLAAEARFKMGDKARQVGERIRDMQDAVHPWGVTRVALERKIGKPLEVWTHEDVDIISSVHRAIESGEVDVSSIFDLSPETQKERKEAVVAVVKEAAAATVETRKEIVSQNVAEVTNKRDAFNASEAWASLWADYTAARESEPAGSQARAALEARWKSAWAKLGIKAKSELKNAGQIKEVRALIWPERETGTVAGKAVRLDADGIPF